MGREPLGVGHRVPCGEAMIDLGDADTDEFPGLPWFDMTIRWTRCPGCGCVILEFEWKRGFEFWDGHAECIDCRQVPF